MSDDEVYVSSDGSASDEENENDENDEQQMNETGKRLWANEIVDVHSLQEHVKQQCVENDKTVFIMTKYEYTRVKGERLEQLNSGGIPFVPYTSRDTNESIFLREFKDGKLPFLLERKTPDGGFQYIKIRQFANRDSDMFE